MSLGTVLVVLIKDWDDGCDMTELKERFVVNLEVNLVVDIFRFDWGNVNLIFEKEELGAFDWHLLCLAMADKGHGPFSSIVIVRFVPNSNVGSLTSTSLACISRVFERGCSLSVFANDGVNIWGRPDLSLYFWGTF